MFRNMTFIQKQVALFLVFGLVPMAILGVIAYRATGIVEGQNVARFENVARTIADKIDRNLFERYGDVQAFGLNHAIFDREPWYMVDEADNRIMQAMNRYVDTYDIYSLTILVDLRGQVITVNSRDADGKPIDTTALYEKNYSQAPWFQALQAGTFTTRMPFTAPGNDISSGTFIEDVHVDADVKAVYPGDDGLTLGFSAPVYQDGQVIAYWSNRARFSLVEEIFQSAYAELKAEGYPGVELTLLDRQGRIIVDYDPVRTGTEAIGHDFDVVMKLNLAEKGVAAAQEAIAGKAGHGISFHARKEIEQASGWVHLKGALGYPGMDWAVLARAPRREASAGVIGIRRNILLTVGVCLGVILVLGIFIGRRFSKPLVAMAQAADQIAAGNLDQQVHYQSRDEIGTLATALNTMVANLRQMLTSVTETTEALTATSGELTTASDETAGRVDTMDDVTTTTTARAKEMSANMTVVASTTDQATQNVHMVATATEGHCQLNAKSSRINKILDGLPLRHGSFGAVKGREISFNQRIIH